MAKGFICFISPISINIYRLFARPGLRCVARNTAIRYRCLCPAALRLPPRFVQTSRGNASSVSDRRFSPLYLVDQKLWIRSVCFPSARGGYRTSSRMISRQPPREFPLPQTPSNHGKPTFYTWTYICRDLCTPFAVHAEAREINQL